MFNYRDEWDEMDLEKVFFLIPIISFIPVVPFPKSDKIRTCETAT